MGFLSSLTAVLLKARTQNLLTSWKEESNEILKGLLSPKSLDFIPVLYWFQQADILNSSFDCFVSYTCL